MQSLLYPMQIGECHPMFFRSTIEHKRLLRLMVSKKKRPYEHSINVSSMQLDPVEYHYLLTAGTDRNISIYNAWTCGNLPKVSCVQRENNYNHTLAISNIQWYPHDTGMFVTSSYDGTIKVWDTNRFKPAETMLITHPVCDHHLSSLATSHSLIAATASCYVRLADMRTGSTAHVLKGHRGNVLCVRWSPKDEYLLASGSEDNKVLMWDVRHSKAMLRNLDQHNGDGSSRKRAGATAHGGSVNSLLFNEDGRFLLSFGTDERMRLWNTDTGENTLVNYGPVANSSTLRTIRMCLHQGGHSSSVVMVPSERFILLFDLFSGSFLRRLSEHFGKVACCEYNPTNQELYSTESKSNIYFWTPDDHRLPGSRGEESRRSATVNLLFQDSWSDSD